MKERAPRRPESSPHGRVSRFCRAVCLALGVSAAAATAAAPEVRAADPPIGDRVAALLELVRSPNASVRKKALDGVRALGSAAIPELLSALGRDAAAPQFDAAVAALIAVGPDEAIAEIQSRRLQWMSLGFLDSPDKRKGRRVLDELEERLLAARTTEWSKPVRLVAAELDDGFRVPPWAATAIDGTLPSHLAWDDVPVRVQGRGISVDAALDGRFATKPDPVRGGVVAVGTGPKPRRVLVFPRLGKWYAASPSIVRGALPGRIQVEVLDVEGDGDFTGREDLIRFGDEAFRHVGAGEFVWLPAGLHRFRLRRDAEGLAIATVPEPEPAWLAGPHRDGMAALSAWRGAAGLAPQRAERTLFDACGLHHEYWRRYGFTGHDEDPERPGWTADGARAGQSSSCWERGTAPEFIRVIGATVLHRSSLLGSSERGVGLFAGSAGVLLWGADIAAPPGRPVLVPAAGQVNVPLLCEAEIPKPSADAGFYSRERGWPVSVTLDALDDPDSAERRLEVFAGDSPRPLPGTTFSRESRYHDGHQAGFPERSVIFLSDGPLPAGTLFTARLSWRDFEKGASEFVWQFRTR